jgi:hypothetical protein
MYNANQGCGTGVGQPADLPRKTPVVAWGGGEFESRRPDQIK